MMEQLDLLTPRGSTFNAEIDGPRLARQTRLVWEAVRGGDWWSLRSLSDATGCPEASVSARLRQLRTLGLVVERERTEVAGVWRYRVLPSLT